MTLSGVHHCGSPPIVFSQAPPPAPPNYNLMPKYSGCSSLSVIAYCRVCQHYHQHQCPALYNGDQYYTKVPNISGTTWPPSPANCQAWQSGSVAAKVTERLEQMKSFTSWLLLKNVPSGSPTAAKSSMKGCSRKTNVSPIKTSDKNQDLPVPIPLAKGIMIFKSPYEEKSVVDPAVSCADKQTTKIKQLPIVNATLQDHEEKSVVDPAVSCADKQSTKLKQLPIVNATLQDHEEKSVVDPAVSCADKQTTKIKQLPIVNATLQDHEEKSVVDPAVSCADKQTTKIKQLPIVNATLQDHEEKSVVDPAVDCADKQTTKIKQLPIVNATRLDHEEKSVVDPAVSCADKQTTKIKQLPIVNATLQDHEEKSVVDPAVSCADKQTTKIKQLPIVNATLQDHEEKSVVDPAVSCADKQTTKIKQLPIVNATLQDHEEKSVVDPAVSCADKQTTKIKQLPIVNATLQDRAVLFSRVAFTKKINRWEKMKQKWMKNRRVAMNSLASSTITKCTAESRKTSSKTATTNSMQEHLAAPPTDGGGYKPQPGGSRGNSRLLGKRGRRGRGTEFTPPPKKRARQDSNEPPKKSELDIDMPLDLGEDYHSLVFSERLEFREKAAVMLTDPSDISPSQYDFGAHIMIPYQSPRLPFYSEIEARNAVEVGCIQEVNPPYVAELLELLEPHRAELNAFHGLTMNIHELDYVASRSSILLQGHYKICKSSGVRQQVVVEVTKTKYTQADLDSIVNCMSASNVHFTRPIQIIELETITCIVQDYVAHTLRTFLRDVEVSTKQQWGIVTELLKSLAQLEPHYEVDKVDITLSGIGVHLDAEQIPHVRLNLLRGSQTPTTLINSAQKRFASIMALVLTKRPLTYVAGHWIVHNQMLGNMSPILGVMSQLLSRQTDLVPSFSHLVHSPVFGTGRDFLTLIQGASDLLMEDKHAQRLKTQLDGRKETERLLYGNLFLSWKNMLPPDLVAALQERFDYSDRPIALLRVFRNTNNHTIQFVIYLCCTTGNIREGNLSGLMLQYIPLFFTWIMTHTSDLRAYQRMTLNYPQGHVSDPFSFVEVSTVRSLLKLDDPVSPISNDNVYSLGNLLFQIDVLVSSCFEVSSIRCELLTAMTTKKNVMENFKNLPRLTTDGSNEETLRLLIIDKLRMYLAEVQRHPTCNIASCLIHDLLFSPVIVL